jgi:hypothetical protein
VRCNTFLHELKLAERVLQKENLEWRNDDDKWFTSTIIAHPVNYKRDARNKVTSFFPLPASIAESLLPETVHLNERLLSKATLINHDTYRTRP